ncbi:hypothetical protein [Cellulomonas sp. SLBN-39]|uniref:hypothetical protein n=1 Tax=Cellulomonas sp. SLBN-39 TaxID=2768446 RepID=UPI00114E3D01|nr:hypothetical protein [Cellulomonas sp. SLBN-39]TQL02674.1 hypothetical protein FBY24_1754 [Cellulomonas sp. SLBN-39]
MPLPDLREAGALHDLGVIRTDQLPDLAARWLAADVVDSEAVRLLAGHARQDPEAIERLMRDALHEAQVEPLQGPSAAREVVLEHVSARWRLDHDTRGAVALLARLGESRPDLHLDEFIGLDDEWTGGWGRLAREVEAAAETTLSRSLPGS